MLTGETNTGSWIGVGVYSVPDVVRLTGISRRRIVGWAEGYRGKRGLWTPQLPRIGNELALTFREMQEARVVAELRGIGFSWRKIQQYAEKLGELYGDSYPFSSRNFKYKGRELFEDGGKILREVIRGQNEMRPMIVHALGVLRSLEYGPNGPTLWRPMGARSHVVLDPQRRFGQPIVDVRGVPTSVIWKTYLAESESRANAAIRPDVVKRVAWWYDVSAKEASDAIRYERGLTGNRKPTLH